MGPTRKILLRLAITKLASDFEYSIAHQKRRDHFIEMGGADMPVLSLEIKPLSEFLNQPDIYELGYLRRMGLS